ncbi:MAG: translation initiation factor IF-2, partial [Methanobacteriota archaeon]
MPAIRQPIVSVLGHVDHGKTTVLDRIRGTAVASREAGGLTQPRGATAVPLPAILDACGDLVRGKSFKIPGLLFIDTPGHVAFATLRARGGALADLAVLVVDVNEGFRPQTIESVNILKRYKTPFVVAANKIDLVPGWRKHEGAPFVVSVADQPAAARDTLDTRLYDLVGRLFEHGFSADRYDKVSDFATTLAVVPTSAKFGVGIADLLLMLIGLAQRFLEAQLTREEGPGEATILEVKEEKGHGITLDAIVYKGTLRRADPVVFGTTGEPGITKVKALLKPKPLDEIRDPQDRFDSVASVTAAAGVKVAASGLEAAVAGAPLRVARSNVKAVVAAVADETQVHVETQDDGLLAKADAIGSLEGLAYECRQASIPLKFARIGPVARRDVVDAATVKDPLHRAILAFQVDVLPDAEAAIAERPDLKILSNDVVYRLIED